MRDVRPSRPPALSSILPKTSRRQHNPGPVTDLHRRLRAILEGRYAIERELGRGCMATVPGSDSPHDGLEEQLRSAPDDAQLHVLHGLSLALAGRKAEAVAEGEHAVAVMPLAADGYADRICRIGSHGSTSSSASTTRRWI